MRYITFALAKGRLAKKAMALLEEIGITCEEMKDEKTRKLIFVNEELKLKFFLSKASDVPTYVEYGAADIGVVGKDTILEEGRNLYEVLDLKFGACKMCVCGPKEAKKYLNSNEIIRVASKYPHIAKEYFNNQGTWAANSRGIIHSSVAAPSLPAWRICRTDWKGSSSRRTSS